ncbi:transcription factor PAR2 [Ricinus communis]|uniref:Transcription factor n=1 Tax=Ricinus communis TaxID=3988 RepID=B9S4M3_RICCO|nr:transcription factor PAR2 [Ricinus communis]EEF41446.1 conserved hypothetical protein [Ricinus communis]|eukprot:XP_002521029.1 transcription factor PAR2 [Ricinus communis]
MGMNGCRDVSKVNWRRTTMGRRRRRRRRRGAATATTTSIQMRVKKLQRLIPGGEELQPDRLFLRTADYILHLELQVNVLQALSEIYTTP